MKKWLGLLMLVIGVGIIVEREHIANMVQLPSSVYAKEYCSCIYVVEHDATYCDDYVPTLFPVSVNINSKDKTITSSVFGVENSARFVGERAGCGFVN